MDDLASSGLSSNPEQFRQTLIDALDLEDSYTDLIEEYRPLLTGYSEDPGNPPARILDVIELIEEMPTIEAEIADNILFLDPLLAEIDDMIANGVDPTAFQEIVSSFYSNQDLHTKTEVDGSEITWKAYLTR